MLTSPTQRPFEVRPGVRAAEDDRAVLALMDGFQLRHRRTALDLAPGVQRLLAFLALHRRPLGRGVVAGTLWPNASEQRAAASLRSALWRINQVGVPLVAATARHIALDPSVAVDVREVEALADRVLESDFAPDAGADHWYATLRGDVLPDWNDPWVVLERERLRQRRLHVLEALSENLTDAGRFGQAIHFGLAAVAGDPLRESAHRVVIKAYVAEGNRGEALRHYGSYRRLLRDELDVDPSPAMAALVGA